MERRRSKVSTADRRSLHRHPKSPPFPVKNTSKIPQKNLINFWQRFEKNLAKTSKKDDKQNPLTALEVRRAFQNSARSHPESARKRLNNPEDQGLVTG
jgi:hypothetical protein